MLRMKSIPTFPALYQENEAGYAPYETRPCHRGVVRTAVPAKTPQCSATGSRAPKTGRNQREVIRKLLPRLTMRLVRAPGVGVANSPSGSNW